MTAWPAAPPRRRRIIAALAVWGTGRPTPDCGRHCTRPGPYEWHCGRPCRACHGRGRP